MEPMNKNYQIELSSDSAKHISIERNEKTEDFGIY